MKGKTTLLTLLCLGLLSGCASNKQVEQTSNDVIDSAEKDVSNDFEELGKETEDSLEEDSKTAKEDETFEGDFNDLY